VAKVAWHKLRIWWKGCTRPYASWVRSFGFQIDFLCRQCRRNRDLPGLKQTRHQMAVIENKIYGVLPAAREKKGTEYIIKRKTWILYKREWKWIGISPTRESLVNLFCVPVFHYFTSFQITVSSTYKSWEGIVDERPTINHAKLFTFSLWMRFILSVTKVKLETLGSSSDPSNFYVPTFF
jgi:hypothetical protein